jgi:hypothetical protein
MKTLATSLTPTERIESLTNFYAEARTMLGKRLQALEDDVAKARKLHISAIRFAAGRAKEIQDQLKAELEAHPELFVQPRSFTVAGIKVGYKKGAGAIEWDDDEKVAAAIKKHLPEQYDILVKETRKPLAKALKNVAVADLKRVGCTVEETGDQVFIKAADSEIDKLVGRILEEGAKAEEQA